MKGRVYLYAVALLATCSTRVQGLESLSDSSKDISSPSARYEELPTQVLFQERVGNDRIDFEGKQYSIAISPLLYLKGCTQLLEGNQFLVEGFGLACQNIGVSCTWILRNGHLHLLAVKPYGSVVYEELSEKALSPTSVASNLSPWIFKIRSFLREKSGSHLAEWFNGKLRLIAVDTHESTSSMDNRQELWLSFISGKLVSVRKVTIQSMSPLQGE